MENRFKKGYSFILDGEIYEVKSIIKGYYLCEYWYTDKMEMDLILCEYADSNAEQLPF